MTTSMSPQQSSPAEDRRRQVVVVTSPACHLCEDAVTVLEQLDPDQLVLTVVQAVSPDGRRLVERHRPAMFPLVIVDDDFFSAGRVPRRKLDKLLAATEARS